MTDTEIDNVVGSSGTVGLKNYIDSLDIENKTPEIFKDIKRGQKRITLTNAQKTEWRNIVKKMKLFYDNTRHSSEQKFKNAITQKYFIDAFSLDVPITKLTRFDLSPWQLIILDAYPEAEKNPESIDILSHLVEYYKKTTGLGKKIQKDNFDDILIALSSLKKNVLERAIKGDYTVFLEEHKFGSNVGGETQTLRLELSHGHTDIASDEFRENYFDLMDKKPNIINTTEPKPHEQETAEEKKEAEDVLADTTPPPIRPGIGSRTLGLDAILMTSDDSGYIKALRDVGNSEKLLDDDDIKELRHADKYVKPLSPKIKPKKIEGNNYKSTLDYFGRACLRTDRLESKRYDNINMFNDYSGI